MKVKYIGPSSDGVYVPAADLEAKPGEIIEVTDELGVSLCEQATTWEPGDKAAAKTFADFLGYLAAAAAPPADPPSIDPAAAAADVKES